MAEKQISVKLSDEIIKSLDIYAQKYGKNRHDLIKGTLEIGIAEINDFKKVGIFQLGMMVIDLQRKVEDKMGIKPKVKNEADWKPIPVKLSDEFIEQLDQLSERADITRHKLMQNFIKVGLEELAFLDKSGVLKVATTLKDIGKGFKKIYDLGKKALNSSDK